MKRIAIIGGGASGLLAANYLVRHNVKALITIFERNKGLGRKILASGNGKCNFMNYKALPFDYNNYEFMKLLFEQYPVETILNYFKDLGLMFKFDNEGRMYPVSDSSETILSLLTYDLDKVDIRLNTTVTNLINNGSKYLVNDEEFDYVILASGSNASIDKKKQASTYSYLANLGLKINEPTPGLVGFKVKNNIKLLAGMRHKALVNLYLKDKLIKRELGEVIFKDDGISGICVMDLSRYYQQGLPFTLSLNLLMENNELIKAINLRYQKNKDPKYFLAGAFHPKLINYLISNNIIEPKEIAHLMQNFKLEIKSVYDMENAQVALGGVVLDEVNSNLSLKKDKHIYVAGELLDIDGKCGGYNLLFAFLSGYIIAKSIAGEINEVSNK